MTDHVRCLARRLWRDLLSPEDVAALDPGLPEGFERRPDIVFIGGGIVGVTVALPSDRRNHVSRLR